MDFLKHEQKIFKKFPLNKYLQFWKQSIYLARNFVYIFQMVLTKVSLLTNFCLSTANSWFKIISDYLIFLKLQHFYSLMKLKVRERKFLKLKLVNYAHYNKLPWVLFIYCNTILLWYLIGIRGMLRRSLTAFSSSWLWLLNFNHKSKFLYGW